MSLTSLASTLRKIRKNRGLSQEAFSDTSSRTYLSSLERGLKNPTLKKLEELCVVMKIHPLTLLTLSYAGQEIHQIESLLELVRHEIDLLLDEQE